MKVYVYCLVAALLGTAVAWGQVDGVPRSRTEIADDMEVLTRGPVHEAFAETDFTHRHDHEEARPARTFTAQQQQLGGKRPQPQNMSSVIAQQLDQFRKTEDSSLRFQQVNDDDRQQFGRRGQAVQSLREQRQQLEAKVADPTAAPSVQGAASARVKLPKSPFVARRADEFGEHQRPPQSHAQPQLDSKLVPTPRRRENSSADTSPAPPKVKASPQAEPKAEPKAAPKVAPKVDAKAAPKVEREAAPKVEPKAAPKAAPKDKPKDKPKGKP